MAGTNHGIPFDWRQARSLKAAEKKLRDFVIAHNANSIESIRDPAAQAEALLLKAQVDAERERLKLLATTRAMERIERAHEKRRAELPERMAKKHSEMTARVRRALAQTRGNKSAAARLMGVAKTTFDKWHRTVIAEDANNPRPTCALCGQVVPDFDRTKETHP